MRGAEIGPALNPQTGAAKSVRECSKAQPKNTREFWDRESPGIITGAGGKK